MPKREIILTDCCDPNCPARFRLSDPIKAACTWTDARECQEALVRAWLRGDLMAHVGSSRALGSPNYPAVRGK